jgi:hypothetical protein
MKKVNFVLIGLLALSVVACASDKHAMVNNPQKIISAVTATHPGEKNTLVYIGASDGWFAPFHADAAVANNVNNGKVVAIISALALKDTRVIVAGEDESLTTATLAKAFTMGKAKIGGANLTVVGGKDSQKTLSALAAASGVNIEYMGNPN